MDEETVRGRLRSRAAGAGTGCLLGGATLLMTPVAFAGFVLMSAWLNTTVVPGLPGRTSALPSALLLLPLLALLTAYGHQFARASARRRTGGPVALPALYRTLAVTGVFLAAGLVLTVLLGALLGLVGHDADAGLGAAGIATLGMFFLAGRALVREPRRLAGVPLAPRRTGPVPEPAPGSRPRPGQIWFAYVPFEEGHDGKDRPCLVLRCGPRAAEVLKITSQDKSRFPRQYRALRLPGEDGRQSWLQLEGPRRIGYDAFRRPVGVSPGDAWDEVSRRHGVAGAGR
ncbi:hypothetical protein C0Q59_12445 [Streptomyces albidoflavus]|uniref:hypothetical protein n=1 Tax=Streptomyces albidoflavus TaxID=1886 RepID=UPI001020FD87|nr:hypothetical protein [Streptomyces albidoflavus]RZD63253.1 hypothetical protein C0Q59_12445 [Streptomyces albidoflavus]